MSSDRIWDIVYGIFVAIDVVIYKFVGWLYQLFILISSAKIFNTETFELFINRIYIILGVIMLFFLAYTILKNIADPDSFTKGDSSMGKIISNTVISLVLIAILPTIFTFLYNAQEILLSQNIIGKIILGNYSTAVSNLEVQFTGDNADICTGLNNLGGNLKTTGNGCVVAYEGDKDSNSVNLAGNSIAVDIFSAMYYPFLTDVEYQEYENDARQQATELGEDEDSFASSNQFYNKEFEYQNWIDDDAEFKNNNKDVELYETIAAYDPCHNLGGGYAYGAAARRCSEDIKVYNGLNNKNYESLPLSYKSIMQYAKTTGDMDGFKLVSNFVTEGVMDYSFIISTVAGLFVCYIMVSYCIDMGLRAAKLGFAQLVAPIPILARIVPSQNKMFSSWMSFTLRSYFEVFLRIAIIFLGVFMITNLPNVQGLWEDSILTKISVMSIKFPMIMNVNSASWALQNLARVAVIIGILMFVKQAPQLIQEALGITVNTGSLNIRNKLRNMVGGERLVNGASRAASFAAGGVTGAIGAGYMSWKNGGGFGQAALKGWREGSHAGGNQFRAQGQQAYHDTTGDKYRGSFAPWARRSISGHLDARYDQRNKAHQNRQVERFNEIIDQMEGNKEKHIPTSAAFQNRMNNVRLDNGMTLSQFEANRSHAEAQAQIAHNRTVQDAENIRQKAQQDAVNFKNNEAAAIAQRKAAFENSREYNNAKYMARANAAAEAQQKAGSAWNNMSQDEKNKQTDALLAKHMEEQLKNMNSDAAKNYLKDQNRNLDAEAQEIIKKANAEAKKMNDSADATLDQAMKKAKADFDAGEAAIRDAARKEIRANPQGRAEQMYADAHAELDRRGENDRYKDMRNALADMFNNNNNK